MGNAHAGVLHIASTESRLFLFLQTCHYHNKAKANCYCYTIAARYGPTFVSAAVCHNDLELKYV
jgi:hypothetical protein